MMVIVKKLEVFRLGPKLTITPEPLAAKKSVVVRIIELFHCSIAPRFSDGNENDLDPQG